MDRLPPELVLQIAHYAFDIVKLHLVSKRLRQVTRDDKFWKRLCFEDSNSAAIQKRRDLQFIAPSLVLEPARVFELQRRARTLSSGSGLAAGEAPNPNYIKTQRAAIANWDPSYTNGKVDWYEEYVARHAPISMSWLQQPINHPRKELQDIRGLGVYDRGDKSLIVAPVDEGGLCIWGIGRQDELIDSKAGAVVARSKPGLFYSYRNHRPGPPNGYRLITSAGVTVEGVSVDKARNKAFFAKANDLHEVDLETLQISSHERYPFAISALSEAAYPLPLTVATTHSLHLHDPRAPSNMHPSDHSQSTQVENCTANLPPSPRNQSDFHRILAGDGPYKHAPLFQPGPLSITHLPSSHGRHDASNGHICVAGRFPSILTYNRRMFPRLSSTIHSGSRLSSMTSLPYPLLYPRTNLSMDPNATHTLIACGEYNGKGALELYPFSTSESPSAPSQSRTPPIPYKNRTSASSSKLLSVTPHGTRLVFSDSDGGLKWVERDGHSLVRRWNINAYAASVTNPNTYAPNNNRDFWANEGSTTHDGGNVARKLLPVGDWEDSRGEIAVWTGERIGILGFQPGPRWEWEWRDEKVEEEVVYEERMRRALERQADEVRWMTGLGLGV
ncbi:MAG: hypothetical protein Q9201_003329 [Fulgogasparrea decipioides]